MSISTRLQGRAVPAKRSQEKPKEEYIVRFEVHQRIQHFLMMSTFITLALTGLPQRFSEVGASQWWVDLLGGLESVRAIHRAAGVIMLVDCVYHVGYLIMRIGVQRRYGAFQMAPSPKDVKDAFHMGRYFLGLEKEKPRFGRFSYLEKFDYWAVFWGIAVIGTSGVVLMFAVSATRILPGQAIPLATTVHGDEAVLAVGWIAIVHMFNAHLAPWVFPFNPAIFTGRLSRERYAEDHPLEYARIVGAEKRPVPAAQEKRPAPAAPEVRPPIAVPLPQPTRAAPAAADGVAPAVAEAVSHLSRAEDPAAVRVELGVAADES